MEELEMTLQYNQIIVAVDGSKESEWAFKKSVAIAGRNNATLNLVNIIDTRSYALSRHMIVQSLNGHNHLRLSC